MCVWVRGDVEHTHQMWGMSYRWGNERRDPKWSLWWCDCNDCCPDSPLLLSVPEVRSDLSPPTSPFLLTGSARRKLTCTICNRKCSSSLNLQEHRKVRLYGTYRSAQIIPTTHSRLWIWSDLLCWCSFVWFVFSITALSDCFLLCGGIHHAGSVS